MEKKSFVNGALMLAAAGLIVKLIGAVYRIPLNNIVGVEGMRYYDIVYRYFAWLLVISSSGLPTAISKLVSERITLNDRRGAHAVFHTSLVLLLFIGTLTSLLMFFGAKGFSAISYPKDAVDEISKQAMSFRALAPSLMFVSVMCAYRGYLQGMQHMEGTAASQVMEQVGKLAIGFFLAVRFIKLELGAEYAVMGALIGVSAAEFLALVVIYIFYRRKKQEIDYKISREKKRGTASFKSISKKLLAIALPVTIGASIMPITGIIDGAFIIRMLGNIGFTVSEAGDLYSLLYSFVTPIINMPAVLTTALAMSLVPAISSYMAKKDIHRVKNASLTGMKLALIIGTPCAVGLFVLAEPIMGMLYTSLDEAQLTIAASLMKTSCVGVVFLSLVQTLTGVIQGLGRPVAPVINLVFGGILKVITLFVLMRMPTINIQGAAVSTVVCYAAAGMLDIFYLVRKTNMRLNIFDVFIKPIASSVLMGVVVGLLYNALNTNVHHYIATLGSVGVGVVLYLAAIFALKMLSPEDLEFIPGGKKLAGIMYR